MVRLLSKSANAKRPAAAAVHCLHFLPARPPPGPGPDEGAQPVPPLLLLKKVRPTTKK